MSINLSEAVRLQIFPELGRDVRGSGDEWWDELIPLRDAVRLFPRNSRGKRPHRSCLFRWAKSGKNGVILRTVLAGNGEEVPAERFLTEVETVVLDTILTRLSKEVGGNGGRRSLAGVDPATRCYILWRYTYKAAPVEAGEAIIFANGTHVELDGQAGLSAGADALLDKTKGKYRLRDFGERGNDDDLGMPGEDGSPAPLIDALHRTLWLIENRPGKLAEFFSDAQPNREQMRLVAQALAGPGLKGGELPEVSPAAEQAALTKLLANWRSVVDDHAYSPSERRDIKRGQKRFKQT